MAKIFSDIIKFSDQKWTMSLGRFLELATTVSLNIKFILIVKRNSPLYAKTT